MEALVLERKGVLAIREIDIKEELGPLDVRIALHTVGVCGSDVHYYTHGEIGPFVVREPMVLGHEASGVITEVGTGVTGLKKGDRVCMEPGIPDPTSVESRLGMYNLDPKVRFWATPPVHGVLRQTVVHPAAFTFKLPDNISFAEGAMVEPLAVGMHAANKAQIKPGDVAVVSGAGPIGMVTALAALAGGCSRVVMSDVIDEKLELAATLGPITPVNIKRESLSDVVTQLTNGTGADLLFEASGNAKAIETVFEPVRPGGRVVLIGMPGKPVPMSVEAAMIKEISIATIFRYAHVYPRALQLMASGKIDVKPLITDVYTFADSIAAFDYATKMRPKSVKIQIEL
jgi:D-xylulose reductase